MDLEVDLQTVVEAECADQTKTGRVGYVATGRGVAPGAAAGFVVVTTAAERYELFDHAEVQGVPSLDMHFLHW